MDDEHFCFVQIFVSFLSVLVCAERTLQVNRVRGGVAHEIRRTKGGESDRGREGEENRTRGEGEIRERVSRKMKRRARREVGTT